MAFNLTNKITQQIYRVMIRDLPNISDKFAASEALALQILDTIENTEIAAACEPQAKGPFEEWADRHVARHMAEDEAERAEGFSKALAAAIHPIVSKAGNCSCDYCQELRQADQYGHDDDEPHPPRDIVEFELSKHNWSH